MNARSDDIHLLTGAYAVDALDELERARFEAHLDVCADCRLEVAGLTATASTLADTTAVTPPAQLRERVLGGIATVRPLPPRAPDHPGAGAPGRTPRRRWFPVLVLAAALALIAGVGVWQPWDRDSERTLTAAEQVLGASDAERVALDVGDAKATLVRSKSERGAVLVTEDMPPAPDGRVYALWLQSPAGDMVPAGLMPPESDQTVLLEGDASEATAVGITVEPEGGSDEPSTEPIVLFDLTKAAT